MHEFLSYISGKTLNSVDFTSVEEATKAFLTDLGPDLEKDELYEKLLSSNKIKQGKLGQFHTPVGIVDLVLSALPSDFEEQMIRGASLIDPSCGTGNFLLEVVRRIVRHLVASKHPDPYSVVNDQIIPNVSGIEIDPLLAFACRKLFEFEFDGKVNSPNIIVTDSLRPDSNNFPLGNFDFVVGNPPWVEVKELEDEIKEFVQREYKVSNLYGAFILKGREMLKSGGHLSYVIPRSFSGGKYYSKLRETLAQETSISTVSYIKNRNQDFHGGKILQEMVILSFQRSRPSEGHKVTCIPRSCIGRDDFLKQFEVRQDELFSRHDRIMILADSLEDFLWLQNISSFPNFSDHGFRISTGQLVLHRSLDFLREVESDDAKRIIYGHDIKNSDGALTFQKDPVPVKGRKLFAVKRGIKNLDGRNRNKTSIQTETTIEMYCNSFPEIIVFRRRSHKGDKRRFVGLYLSKDLPQEYFLENGLNFMVDETQTHSAPTLKSVSRILRSDLFERFFESVSSNTQINKNDLYLFGMPPVNKKTEKYYSMIEATDFNDVTKITSLVNQLYSSQLEDKK